MYKLIFDTRALNFLNKLNKKDKKRIWNKLEDCKKDPFRFLIPLVGIGSYKLRVGNYRVLIDVENKIRILSVVKIGRRKNIYFRVN
ncbi:type II toxin-antitoxin system RelE/ParE family toxin [Candidatus Woesearchaeota archaeon]|jgi:mRNA interferase RelE/StbE|nr:type II toxin-antitoxin system RelE/ParE family toxin [Candidatus Woesearchaeota archaeon]